MELEKIVNSLKSKGVHPSLPRIRIFEYLCSKRNHPTALTIWENLHPEIPTLSKTTLYNTLSLFVEKKLAIPIVIEENEVRYDAEINVHGHFKCTKCGDIFDFEIESSSIKACLPSNCSVSSSHFYYYGHCSDCKQ